MRPSLSALAMMGAVAGAWLAVASAASAQQQQVITAAEQSRPGIRNVGSFERDLPARRMKPSGPPPPPDAAVGNPAGVTVRKSQLGQVLADSAGKTLYQMNPATIQGRLSGQPLAKFCVGYCATLWVPFAAPADAKPIGPWRVVDGVKGPQWAYGRNPVYTYVGDRRAGDTNGHEYEDAWTAIGYVPPIPAAAPAPPTVAVTLLDGGYVLASDKGLFFTYGARRKDCAAACADARPFLAGWASADVGDWKVAALDGRPQWTYRGKPVFVSGTLLADSVPPSAAILRP